MRNLAVISMLFAMIAAPLAPMAVWCQGSDGHRAVELGAHQHHSHASHAHHEHNCAADADHHQIEPSTHHDCHGELADHHHGSCQDSPLAADATPQLLKSMHLQVAYGAVSRGWLPISIPTLAAHDNEAVTSVSSDQPQRPPRPLAMVDLGQLLV